MPIHILGINSGIHKHDGSAALLRNGALVAMVEEGRARSVREDLLGHPGRRANLIRINRIKQRELWRLLAPSILAEHAAEFFEPIAANLEFMTVAAQIRGDVQHLVPAIVHVDGSTRPHVVRREVNPRYHDLLERFARRSGLPS